MDPRLLQYYNRELQHLREVGAEFAKEFPKIAGRIGLDEFECTDPYVERLLEGFAFLAARVQLKVDAEFPRFTQHLLELVYPQYLAPTPSMAMVQFQPDLTEGALADGVRIERGALLRSQTAKGEQTACEYRTAHELTLWPLQLLEAQYITTPAALEARGVVMANPAIKRLRSPVKAALRLVLQTTGGLKWNQVRVDQLPIFLRGTGQLPFHLYEQLLGNSVALALKPPGNNPPWCEVVDQEPVRRVGFEDNESLLPVDVREFQGYRLLQEYFVFPERFLFAGLSDLRRGARQHDGDTLEVFVLLDRVNSHLVNAIDVSNFSLFCAPTINLFVKPADRIHLDQGMIEHHVVADRTRAADYEVHSVTEAVGFGANQSEEREFLPFYGSKTGFRRTDENAFYRLRREKHVLTAKQKRHGARSSYIGSETYISLVDGSEAPYRSDLRQIGLKTLCTNRDLPLIMPVGVGATDFTLQVGAPVQSIRCVVGPTRPRPAPADGDTAWRLINHLALNYLSIIDTNPTEGAAALRSLLGLYADRHDAGSRKQIEGLVSVRSRNVVRRIDAVGPIVFGRGLEIVAEVDESAFEGTGAFLLGSVLERFFARYATLNSFTEAVIRSTDRGEIMRWPIRIGNRRTV